MNDCKYETFRYEYTDWKDILGKNILMLHV